jgi:hypothetical protein
MTTMATTGQASAKMKTLDNQATNRKGWETKKAFAKECGVDVKVFNKGLGPQYDRLAGLAKGVMETREYVQLDERSFKSLRSEKAKLDGIIKEYRKITNRQAHASLKTVLDHGWMSLDNGLANMQKWADDLIKTSDDYLKQLQKAMQQKQQQRR